MPTHECLGPDDCEDLQDKKKPAIQLDKEPALMVREPDATMLPTLQDNQLMSKHRVLSFKPQLRLEWRGQDGQSETEQPDHSASLGDSITLSTQIRFSDTQRASFSPGSADRCHKFTQYPWRTSSPISSRLGFRYTQPPGRRWDWRRDSPRAPPSGHRRNPSGRDRAGSRGFRPQRSPRARQRLRECDARLCSCFLTQ